MFGGKFQPYCFLTLRFKKKKIAQIQWHRHLKPLPFSSALIRDFPCDRKGFAPVIFAIREHETLFDHTSLSTSNYFNHLVYSSMRTTTIPLKPIIQMGSHCSFHVVLVDINMDAANLLETEAMEWNCSHHYFKLKCKWPVCTAVIRLVYLKHENTGCQISNKNILWTWKQFYLFLIPELHNIGKTLIFSSSCLNPQFHF